MNGTSKAVFLSYASQDAEAAKRICDALRATGVEVWFDQNELVGGDAWDAKIRKQIADCALFVPVISANTQSRREGYFRLEWRIAAQRTHMMSEQIAFLLPVVIDATRDAEADVPAEFKAVQWTRLPGGEAPEKFCARVQKLLAVEVAPASSRPSTNAGKMPALPRKQLSRSWFAPAILGAAAIAALLIWQPWRQKEKPAAAATPVASPTTNTATSTETARIRARLIPDRWQKGDFEALSPTLDRLIQTNPEDSDAWALRSIINSLQVARNFDSGTKPLEVSRAAAERALRLSPESPLGEIALGMHLVAMISRGGDPAAGRPYVARGIAALPPDALTRYADLVSLWQGYNVEGTESSVKAWFAAEPGATFPAWILAQLYITQRRTAEAEKSAEAAAADRNITGTRALYTLFEAKYYLRADLAAAKDALARVPAEGRAVHRIIHARWLLAMAEQRWDEALQELARVSEPMLYDRTFHGPRSLLAGMAHQRAGRTDAALVQFREAERLLRSELASDADNEELHLVLAVTLACAGRAIEARSELALVEPLLKGRASSVYWGALVVSIAQTYGAIGDSGNMAQWLRKLFVEPSGFPFTPASLRIDPRFAGKLDAPEIQALLKEFASLDQPKESASAVAPDNKSAPADKSVAVLAFENLSGEKDNEYFSDGISEELLNVLAKVPGLKVSARTSAFYFKGKQVQLPEIAKQLGVAYVVEGSVRKSGTKVRITAQLIKAADGFHVWSDNFDRELKDIFAVQDEIAGLIAKNLQLTLGASSAGSKVAAPQVYQFYFQGREAWNLRTAEGYVRAEEFFNRAIAADPTFARAYVGRADVWMIRDDNKRIIGRYSQRNSPALAKIVAEIDHALTLEPNLAEAHASLGYAHWDGWDVAGAERELRLAVKLNPNYTTAHHWLGVMLQSAGKIDEALAEFRLATELDPLTARIAINFARALLLANQPQEALAFAERAEALQPDSPQVMAYHAWALTDLGRLDEALIISRRILAAPATEYPRFVARTFARAGLPAEAERAIARITEPAAKPFCLASLGRLDEFLANLDPQEICALDTAELFFKSDFDPIRFDPRFVKVLETVGASEAHARAQAWRAAHPPEKPATK